MKWRVKYGEIPGHRNIRFAARGRNRSIDDALTVFKFLWSCSSKREALQIAAKTKHGAVIPSQWLGRHLVVVLRQMKRTSWLTIVRKKRESR